MEKNSRSSFNDGGDQSKLSRFGLRREERQRGSLAPLNNTHENLIKPQQLGPEFSAKPKS